MSEKDEVLIRRLWKGVRIKGFDCSKKWGYVMAGYARSLPRDVFGIFVETVRCLPDACEECHINNLKELSRMSLERVLERDELWRMCLLDLKVLGGFDTVLNRKDPFEEYQKDYGTESEQKFDERLKFWIDDTLDKIDYVAVDFSFEDFVSFRDGWAMPGASVQGTAKKVQVVGSDGSRKSLRVKDKWFALSHLDDDEIVRRCWGKEKTIVRPFVKQDEPAACRTVQCYDTWSIIRTSFIEQGLGDLNGKGQWTSIGLGSEDRQKMRRRLLYHAGDWKLCTDQSGFDVHQNIEWVKYVARALFARIGKRNPSMRRLIAKELESLDNVFLEFEGREMEWKNGVLSGYKFTALFDSILNRAETRWVLEKMRREDIKMETYQGDDAIVVLSGWICKSEVAEVYRQLGLEVHSEKTWVTRGNTEYLHEVYLRNRVVGFPARAFRAIAWKKPLSNLMEAEVGWDKLKALLGVMRMAVRRGLKVNDMVRRILRNYGLVLGDKFREWWSTPYVFGGFGAGTWGRIGLVGERVRRKGVQYRMHVRGLAHRGDLWLHAAMARAEGALPIPGIKTVLSWEAVKGSATMDKMEADRAMEEPRVKVDWTLADLTHYRDAYLRKLKLEWKLRTGEKIIAADLPRFFGYMENIDRAYRKYRKLISDKVGIDETSTSGESHYRLSDWANDVWAGLCYRRVRVGDVPDLLPMLRYLQKLMMDSVYKRNLLVVSV
jgi:hypothetical protein